MIGKVDKPTEIKRYRDVVRKASIHGDYVIIGVEHQSTFDKNMIFRILNYDATIYINQVESKQEVYPVGSFVFYTGDEEWNLPETLKRSLKEHRQQVSAILKQLAMKDTYNKIVYS